MLSFITYDGLEFFWQVGKTSTYANNVKSLIAKGKELEYLKKNIPNLPTGNKLFGEVRWLGKDAQYIVSNLM